MMNNTVPTMTSAAKPSTAMRSFFSRSAALASRQSRWLLAVAALAPMSLAWGLVNPSTATATGASALELGIGQLPHGAMTADQAATCGTAAGGNTNCHASGGLFTGASLTISLPDDATVLPDGTTTLTVTFATTSDPAATIFGFHVRASSGTFAIVTAQESTYTATEADVTSVTYYVADDEEGSGLTVAKNNYPAADDGLSYYLHWASPADVEDQQDVSFTFCAQGVDGNADVAADGPSVCDAQMITANQKPQIADQDETLADAESPADFVLEVNGGLAGPSAPVLTVTAVPEAMGGTVTDADGTDVMANTTFSLTVADVSTLALTFTPAANASGDHAMVWTVSDGIDTAEATVTFTIPAPTPAPTPAPAPAAGGDDDDGGCALSLDAEPAAPASGLLLAALLAMLWRRRRAGLGDDGRACRVAPPAG